MKRSVVVGLLAATLLVAPMANAQRMMGGRGPGGGMMGGGAVPGGMIGGDMMGQSLTVAPDGMVYTLRAVTVTGSTTPAVEVVAVRPSGTVAWTSKVDGGMTRLELSGALVLVATGANGMMDATGNLTVTPKSRLVALSSASGLVQWQIDVDGVAASVTPFSGGTYVLVMKVDGIAGGMMGGGSSMSMKRSLVAVDNSGRILWTLALN